MSTRADVLGLLSTPHVSETTPELVQERSSVPQHSEEFETAQLRGLVRQVFFPGWPRPARQVVLSSLDDRAEPASTAVRIGRAMAAEIPGNVGVIEVAPLGDIEDIIFGRSTPEQTNSDQRPAVLRKSSRQILPNLWLVPCHAFLAEHHQGLSASWLRGRLSELRLEFDYVLINAPPVNRSSEAALLGSLTDGIILTITANVTRRIAAKKSRSALRQANARLLGTVLCERTFPIPERLYRKL